MGLAKDYSLAIVLGLMGSLILWWFLKLLVVPENKRKFIVFSFRPIDSVVFLNIKYVLFLYSLTPFLWMLVQWTTEMHLFHIGQNIIWVKIHFNTHAREM